MSNRHSAGTAVQWRITRPALAVLCVLIFGVIAASAAAVRSFGSSTTTAQPCGQSVTIHIAAAPAMVKPLEEHARKWNDIRFIRDDKCIIASVVDASPANEAALLATGSADRPAIWVPDSTEWVGKLLDDMRTRNQDGHIARVSPHAALASSPLVVVSSPAKAAQFAAGGGATWSSIRAAGSGLAMENPLQSSDGLIGLEAIQSSMGSQPGFSLGAAIAGMAPNALPDAEAGFKALKADPKTAPMFLATEQEVIAANRANGKTFAAATYPNDGTLTLDYPAVRLDYPGDDPVIAAAADGFYSSFATNTASAVNPVGLRNGSGQTKPTAGGDVASSALPFAKLPDPSTTAAQTVWSAWPTAQRNPRMVFALDVSTPMNVSLSNGQSVIQTEAESTVAFTSSFLPDSAEVGIWTYATHLGDTHDWVERIGIGSLGGQYDTGTRRVAIGKQTDIAQLQTNDGSALYDTALDAFYFVTNNYQVGRPNVVVLLTGGSNRDASGVSLDQLLVTLRQQFNPDKPVRIISIAIGDGADNTALNLISNATGANSYVAHTSNEAVQVLVDNLVQKP